MKLGCTDAMFAFPGTATIMLGMGSETNGGVATINEVSKTKMGCDHL